MTKFGIGNGVVHMNQGGELARSASFRDMMLHEFGYVVKPTVADSPLQNGGAEIYNNTLAVKVWTLLYGSGLLAKFWFAALLHAVYLHNRPFHPATHKRHHLRAGMGINRMLRISKRSDLVSVSNARAPSDANWIDMILQVSS